MEMKPAYWKFTYAIPGGGWVYAEDGVCIGWFPFDDIREMGIWANDKTYRW